MQRQWYRMIDTGGGPALEIVPMEASKWNEQGFGIFWAVQDFGNQPRQKKFLKKINSWCIEMDSGTKDQQLEKLERAPYPSSVIETKRGFHVYYNAEDAVAENYQEIVQDRLIPYFKADPNAKDICRILRVPGFKHLKNPKEPFEVKEIFKCDVRYTERQMRFNFKLNEKEEKLSRAKQELRKEFKTEGDDLWEKVYNLDCEAALERLSGKACVSYENFSFRRVTSGNLNIFVDNKAMSCWIDGNTKKIGSLDKGGPTIAQWLRWYGHSWRDTIEILKMEFPELWK